MYFAKSGRTPDNEVSAIISFLSHSSVVRVVVADDEPPARRHLCAMLADRPDVTVVGEAATGDEALRLVRTLAPDIAFLDVSMPNLTGVEVARALEDRSTEIVFVTGSDEHAVEAFELGAADYLVKPFDEDRLDGAVKRVAAKRRALVDVTAIASALRSREPSAERIYLTSGDRTVIKRVCEVDWIEAKGKVLHVRSGGVTWETPGPLSDLEESLDASIFVRVARSFLVNLDRVVEVRSWYDGELLLVMADGARIPTSRGYRARLDPIMGRVPRRDR